MYWEGQDMTDNERISRRKVLAALGAAGTAAVLGSSISAVGDAKSRSVMDAVYGGGGQCVDGLITVFSDFDTLASEAAACKLKDIEAVRTVSRKSGWEASRQYPVGGALFVRKGVEGTVGERDGGSYFVDAGGVKWVMQHDGSVFVEQFDTFNQARDFCKLNKVKLKLQSDYMTNVPLYVSGSLDMDFAGYKIIAGTGFAGNEVFKFGTNINDTYSGTVDYLEIDGGGHTVRGVTIGHCQNMVIKRYFSRNLYAQALVQESGYELQVENWECVAPNDLHLVNPSWKSIAGFDIRSSDGHYKSGVCIQYPIGLKSIGGNNMFHQIHNYSVYKPDRPQMLYGFWIEGQGNSFNQCAADSPNTAEAAQLGSPSNGGIGFYIPSGSNGLGTRFTDCHTYVLANGNQPVGAIVGWWLGKIQCTLSGCMIMAGNYSAYQAPIQYASGAVAKETSIIGGNVGEPRDRGYLGEYTTTFTPSVTIGGDSGSTYHPSRRYGRQQITGRGVDVAIHVRLASLSGTGNVKLTGLPTASLNMGDNFRWIGEAVIANPSVNGTKCYILGNSTEAVLIKDDFNPVTHADLGVNTELWINLRYER